MRKQQWSSILLIVLATIAVARTGTVITNAGLPWYETLTLPDWTPSSAFIGLMWTTIFVLTALSAILAIRAPQTTGSLWLVVILFIINAVLNVGWSYVFFGMQDVSLAVWVAALLTISVFTLIVTVWPLSKTSAVLLVPYFVWATVATYLTCAVSALNPLV